MAASVLVVAAITLPSSTFGASGTVDAADALSADAVGAHFVPTQACRLADTRTGTGMTRIDPTTIRVRVAGRCGLPDDLAAVSLNVIADRPTTGGFLTLYPTGIARPIASNLNYRAGQIRSNAAITRVGADGSIDVFSTSGDVVLDTTGAFVDSGPAASGRLVPMEPRRVLDTRPGPPLAPGRSVTIPLPADVPADAAALSLVITVTEAVGAGFVTTHPTGTTRPLASVLNIDASGQTRAAGGIHRVGPDGLTIFLAGGGHVLVDVTGWFTGSSAPVATTGTFVPVDPSRALDTREPRPVENNRVATAPLMSGETVVVPSNDAMTMAVNITSVDAESGFLTAHPAGTARPLASLLNPAGSGDVVANFGIVPTSDAGLAVYSQRAGNVIVDIAGWFTTIEHRDIVEPPATSAPATTAATTVPPLPSTTTTSPSTTTTSTTTSTTSTTTTTTTTTAPSTTTTTSTTSPSTTSTTSTSTTSTTTTTPPDGRPIVYLTFDDGPTPTRTPEVLEMLDRHGVHATFFLVGDHVADHPDIAAATLAAGHAIGNHSWDHPDLRTLSNAEILEQLSSTSAAIVSATGHQPTCMRPPFGYVDPFDGPIVTPTNPNVRSLIASTGLTIEMWTHDSKDWEPTASVGSITAVLDSIPSTPGSESNILMHDWVPSTLTAVDAWLSVNASRFDFRTLPNC